MFQLFVFPDKNITIHTASEREPTDTGKRLRINPLYADFIALIYIIHAERKQYANDEHGATK